MENGTKEGTQTVNKLRERRRRVAQLEEEIILHERAEEGRKKRLEKYLSIFDSMTAIIWCIDREGRVIRANNTAADDFGLPAKDMIGKSLYDFFPPDEASKLSAENREIMDSEQAKLGVIERFTLPTGKKVWGESDKMPYYDENGNVAGVIIFGQSITEHKRAEKKLSEANARWERTFDAVPDLIAILDTDFRIVHANRAMAGRLGLSPEECVGQVCYKAVHGTETPPSFCPHAQLLQDGQGHVAEVCEERLGGDFSVSTAPIFDSQGQMIGCVHVAHDITERKRAEEALRASQLRLSEAMDLARLAYWEADGTTGVFTFNDALYDLIGTTAEREGGYTVPAEPYFRKFVHPDDLSMVYRFIEGVRASTDSDRPDDLEARIIRGDGEVRHILTRLRVVRGPAGQSIKLFGINQDITERKNMEEALRRSEELHRMLAENASDMIWTEDPRSGMLTYVSPSVSRLTGYTVQEALEQPLEERFAPASLAIVKEHMRKTLESASLGQRIENECLELETPCKDGSTIWMETVVGGMYNASGDLVAMQGVSRDVTGRKRTEEALRASRLQLSAAMDLARIVYWEADWETGTFIFNDPFYAFLATTADREGGYRMAASEYVQRFVHPDDWPIVQQSAEGTRTGTEPEVLVNIEHRVVRRDGEIRHIVVRMRGFRDATGRIVRAFGANQDITERKRVETELARVNRALRMLGSSNQVLIDVADEATLLNDVCRIAVEVGGYRMACVGYAEQDEAKTIRPVAQAGFESGYLESVNVTWADCVRGRGPAGVAIRTGQPSIVHSISGDPTFAPWREEAVQRGYQSVIAVPLTGEGRTFGTLSIYADEVGAFDIEEVEILTELADDLAFGITALRTRAEHRRAEEEKVALESRLLQAQKMEAIGQLAGGVAHDFNNILTVITGFGTLIKMAADKHEPINVEYLDQILASSQKAANLTQSLLAFGRKQRINLAPHSIDDMIANTGKLLDRLLTEDIELQITPAAQDLIVMADVTQIDQILINLAANARDAMPHGGLLSIRTEVAELDDEFIKTHGYGEQGTYALLSISDTGVGMDRSTKEHIFEPFFTTKEVGKGTGLGLATVYGIVKQHNGYVVVDSEPHRGTTFRIYLPLVDKKRSGETRRSEEVESGAETVLVVEDDEGVRKLTTEILRAHGYTTMEAADGEDAVKVFMENQDEVDLMILDVVMPKKNGKEAYEEIKKTHPNVRVIFTSGYTGEVILDKGIQGETVDFITKPLTPNGLLRKVREVLDR